MTEKERIESLERIVQYQEGRLAGCAEEAKRNAEYYANLGHERHKKISELEAECSEHDEEKIRLLGEIDELKRTSVIGRGGASVSLDFIGSPSDSSFRHVLFASSPDGDSCSVEMTRRNLIDLAIVIVSAL